MKKIIALAVAGAFVAPVMAAEVSISGEFEADYRDTNGTTSVNSDHAVNITATTETANGITVSGTVGITGAVGKETSLIKLSGDFGALTVGDTSGPTDRIDTIADAALALGQDTGSEDDTNILYQLPSFVPNLTVVVSQTADDGTGGAYNSKEGTGFGLDYSFGPVSAHYATVENVDETSETAVGIKGGLQGISFAYLVGEQEDTVGSVTEDQAYMIAYTMGDVKIFAQNVEFTGADDAVSSDVSVLGLHYSLGGGVTLYAEYAEDDVINTADATSIGVQMKF
jgi:hypothetical protein